MQVEAEYEQQDASHHEAAAADKLKEVDGPTGKAEHDGLDTDEGQQGHSLRTGAGLERGRVRGR